jgi:hypothetical protein
MVMLYFLSSLDLDPDFWAWSRRYFMVVRTTRHELSAS